MKLSRSMMTLAVAAAAGCTQYLPSVGPDYVEPTFTVSKDALPDAGQPTTNLNANCEYVSADAKDDGRQKITPEVVAEWWTRFNDPVLVDLVSGAVSNNVSYQIAQTRLEQANWELLGTYSAFLPKARLGASWEHTVNRGYNSESLLSSMERGGDGSARAKTWNLGAGLDWEIDIFGGSRRATEAAIAASQAAGWSVADAWVELTSQIGLQYVNLRTTQERIAVARTNLVLQSETYDILKSRLDSGIGDELAVNQCAYVVEQTRARIPQLLAAEESLKNALAILAGELPGALHAKLAPTDVARDWMLAPQRLEGLPLDMIRTRPDVKIKERQLAAQAARIGVAKAMWFPKLFITGNLGVTSVRENRLFDYHALMSSFGPSVNWAIFQAGAVYSTVKAEEAKTEAASLEYALAVEKAYAEVRSNYSAYTQEYHRFQALQGAVRAATDAVTISKDLYKNGLKDFNNVLDAQRSRLQLEEELVISRGQITVDLIDLYKSLGGGLAVPDDGDPSND